MKNNRGISLISVIIAILLMAILVVLIWVGIAVMNYVEEDSKKEENNSKIASNNDNGKENSLSSMNLDDLVYDAEYEKIKGDELFKAYKLVKKDGIWDYDYDNPVTYRLSDLQFPYIKIESSDAEDVNKEIKELYDEYENLYQYATNLYEENGILKSDDIPMRLSAFLDVSNLYSAYKNGKILSLVVKNPITDGSFSSNEEMNFSYYTYNFNLDTLELIDYQEYIRTNGYNKEDLKYKIEDLVSKKIDTIFGESIQKEVAKTCVEKTMQRYDDNKMKFFVDKKGNLNVIVTTVLPVEREYYEFIYTIN